MRTTSLLNPQQLQNHCPSNTVPQSTQLLSETTATWRTTEQQKDGESSVYSGESNHANQQIPLHKSMIPPTSTMTFYTEAANPTHQTPTSIIRQITQIKFQHNQWKSMIMNNIQLFSTYDGIKPDTTPTESTEDTTLTAGTPINSNWTKKHAIHNQTALSLNQTVSMRSIHDHTYQMQHALENESKWSALKLFDDQVPKMGTNENLAVPLPVHRQLTHFQMVKLVMMTKFKFKCIINFPHYQLPVPTFPTAIKPSKSLPVIRFQCPLNSLPVPVYIFHCMRMQIV